MIETAVRAKLDPKLLKLIPADVALRHLVVPLRRVGRTLTVAMSDPSDIGAIDDLLTPPGEGPFPVFMSQWNHRGWAQIAVRRGYMALLYAGADSKDDTRDYLALYPQHDWTTLMTRAWGAHRAVDYLHTLQHVDKTKIAITGHSRAV